MSDRGLGRTYPDGVALVRQGESGDCMYVIQAGRVNVLHERDGHEILLNELGSEEFFGEMALFTKSPRSATVRALGEVRVLVVDRRTLLRRIQEDPSLAFRIIERLSVRLAEANRSHRDRSS
jgi:CRP-like cAMP-binding protein